MRNEKSNVSSRRYNPVITSKLPNKKFILIEDRNGIERIMQIPMQ